MSTQPQVALIFNPTAGSFDKRPLLEQIAARWRADGWNLALHPTAGPGDAARLARQAADGGCAVVLAAGGDGTLREVAAGLAGSDTALGLLPTGTGNSFAKEMGLLRPNRLRPQRWLAAAETLLDGRVHPVDVGQTGAGHVWLQWAGVGADSYVVAQMEPRPPQRKRWGRWGYAAECFYHVRSMPRWTTHVTIDDQTISGRYITVIVANCRWFGGGEFLLSRDARLDDGVFEVWLVAGSSQLAVYRYLIALRLGWHRHDPHVRCLHGRRIVIATEPTMPVHLDGDPLGETQLTITLRPRALALLAPPGAPDDLFQSAGVPLRAWPGALPTSARG